MTPRMHQIATITIYNTNNVPRTMKQTIPDSSSSNANGLQLNTRREGHAMPHLQRNANVDDGNMTPISAQDNPVTSTSEEGCPVTI
mmetsp:Transcript_30051/g.56774  ORF Transcript_30051/g.56774 Transcript_30051/m.56774 type:complete len:86 (-) Transcript_30051:298-555(-)